MNLYLDLFLTFAQIGVCPPTGLRPAGGPGSFHMLGRSESSLRNSSLRSEFTALTAPPRLRRGDGAHAGKAVLASL